MAIVAIEDQHVAIAAGAAVARIPAFNPVRLRDRFIRNGIERKAAIGQVIDTVAPAPAQPVVDAVPVMADEAADATSGTIDVVDSVFAGTVSGLGSTVGDVAGSAPVGAAVGALDGLVGGLPILGQVLGDDTLGGLLGPVVDLAAQAARDPRGGASRRQCGLCAVVRGATDP